MKAKPKLKKIDKAKAALEALLHGCLSPGDQKQYTVGVDLWDKPYWGVRVGEVGVSLTKEAAASAGVIAAGGTLMRSDIIHGEEMGGFAQMFLAMEEWLVLHTHGADDCGDMPELEKIIISQWLKR